MRGGRCLIEVIIWDISVLRVKNYFCLLKIIPGGGLPYIIDGDARRNFKKQNLKVTILGVAPVNYIP